MRRDPSGCLEKVLFPDFHIAQDLAINAVTPVEFTPQTVGNYQFSCGMNMFHGAIKVEGNQGGRVIPIVKLAKPV